MKAYNSRLSKICMSFLLMSSFCFAEKRNNNNGPATIVQPDMMAENTPYGDQNPNDMNFEELAKFIKEMTPAERLEYEKMGKEMIKQLPADELGQIAQAFGTTPEEILKEAQMESTLESVKKAMEEESKLFEKLEAEQTAEKGREPATVQEPIDVGPIDATSTSTVIKSKTDSIENTLNSLMQRLDSLIQKSASLKLKDNKIASWRQELADLAAYLPIINKKEHHDRLTQKEWIDLYKSLQDLEGTLKKHEPLVIIPDITTQEIQTPYDVLMVKQDATDKEITKAYNAFKKQYDPEIIATALKGEGASDKDIKHKQKEARLSLLNIDAAYEKIGDKDARAEYDREATAQAGAELKLEDSAQKALDKVTAGLSKALYTQEVLESLEKFLKAYEPVELEKKKVS